MGAGKEGENGGDGHGLKGVADLDGGLLDLGHTRVAGVLLTVAKAEEYAVDGGRLLGQPFHEAVIPQ